MNITTPVLEMPPEVRKNVDRARSETVSKLWMATEKMNILYPLNWTRAAAEEILKFQVTFYIKHIKLEPEPGNEKINRVMIRVVSI